MKKQHRPARRKQQVKDNGYAGKRGGLAVVICSGAVPRFDPPELLRLVVARGREEGTAGRSGAYYHFPHDVLTAPRVVFTKEFAAAADELRSEDLGVTVMSLAGAGVPPGLTWWEWDGRLPDHIPAQPGELNVERMGTLVRADASGRPGTMHFACSGVEAGGSSGRTVQILPFAINFDWRDDFEAPESLLQPASVEDIRRHHAADPYPTLSQAESSPVFMAALTRRFGVVESPYVAKDYARVMSPIGSRPWYLTAPHLLQECAAESMQEATFLLAALLLAHTGCVTSTAVPRGAHLPKPWPSAKRAMLNYNVVDYAPLPQPLWGGPLATGLSDGEG